MGERRTSMGVEMRRSLAWSWALALGLAAASAAGAEPSRVESKRYYEPAPLEVDESVAPNEAAYVRWYHPTYRLGTCSICHSSDDRKNPGPLRAEVNRICLSCHKPIRDMLETRLFDHKPATENCTLCHNPHNSRYRVLLHAPPKELCVRCHVGLGERLASEAVRHNPVFRGNTCLNCHTEHASSIDNLLQGLPSYVCLRCHGADGLRDSDGVALGSLTRKLDENRFHHEPVDKRDCSVCHESHGGANFRLLNAAYPKAFYAKYDPAQYALCIGCHDRERAMSEPRTTALTGFRDGDRNLHSAHVAEPALGRTCRACHGEHAAEQPHMIRKSVPYGDQGWELPINYVPTSTGGRCVKSCHHAEAYDNGGGFVLRHVEVGDTLPNAELATLGGGALPILSGEVEANVFVFFEPNHEHSREALETLSRIAREFEGRSVRCVAVVSDFYSKRVEPKWLRATGWSAARTLVDKGDEYYGKLGQYMYPSFWIADRAFELRAYEPFTGVNYHERIQAQVRRALGEIGQAELEAALNPPPEEDLDAKSRARMNVTYARKLLESGRPDQALAHGLRALEIDEQFAEARGLVCLIYSTTNACDLAAMYCDAVLTEDPANADARRGRELCPKKR